MIEFKVIIEQEGETGQVRFTVSTPSGRATLLERDVALEFMKAVTQVRSTDFRTHVNKPWSGNNDPARQ